MPHDVHLVHVTPADRRADGLDRLSVPRGAPRRLPLPYPE
jgi:hypothetical protein